MPDIEGKYASTSDTHLVEGSQMNAGIRIFDQFFDLATVGGGTDKFVLAKLREGQKIQKVEVRSDQNLAAINFTVGDDDDAAVVAYSQAGPNANKKELQLSWPLEEGGPLDAPMTVKLTPSANMPAVGRLVTKVYVSKR